MANTVTTNGVTPGTGIKNHTYGAPVNPASATGSSIGPQARTDLFLKKALMDVAKYRFFGQAASTLDMPKHMGKTIKRNIYIPLLDDRNSADEGIDANGVIVATAVAASADLLNTDGSKAVPGKGAMYASSKNVGVIQGRMPVLTENGGRVNKVSFTRQEMTGTLKKYGFFTEYTQESLDFDSDSELLMHINREMLNAANEMTEDLIQLDLLSHAGTKFFAGTGTTIAAVDNVVTYDELLDLEITLDQNRTPKNTTLISGTRLTDTLTIDAARYAYCGSELLKTFRNMKDGFGNAAFVPARQYAAGTTLAHGEVGSIGGFRIVIVPEMMELGAGAAPNAALSGLSAGIAGKHTLRVDSGGKTRVYPILVLGEGSFTTVGFQSSGGKNKFTIYHKAPGLESVSAFDPFGEKGLMSIKWYYGFMGLRTERLALVNTGAVK